MKRPVPTNATRQLMRDAEHIAIGLNYEYLGTEHLALAISASPDTSAARLFDACGGDRAKLAADLNRCVKPAPGPIEVDKLLITPLARRVMNKAASLAGKSPVQTAHILLGLLSERDSIAAQTIYWQRCVTFECVSRQLSEKGAEFAEQ